MQDQILIEMKGVQKWYGGYQALRDVDLTVRRGEKIVLCGPSGSGKSTLIRCINRLEPIQQGSIVVNGHAVEETAVILLHFASSALGTVNVSDTIQSPWSWEFTAGENLAYSHTQEACYQIGGTRASLAIPQLDLWHHQSKASWWAPIERERLRYEKEDPLGLQIANFCGVIRGTAEPVVSGREGLKALRVIDAVKRAPETGDLVSVRNS